MGNFTVPPFKRDAVSVKSELILNISFTIALFGTGFIFQCFAVLGVGIGATVTFGRHRVPELGNEASKVGFEFVVSDPLNLTFWHGIHILGVLCWNVHDLEIVLDGGSGSVIRCGGLVKVQPL